MSTNQKTKERESGEAHRTYRSRNGGSRAIRKLAREAREVQLLIEHFLELKKAQLGAYVRNFYVSIALAVVVLVSAITIIIIGVWMLLQGIAVGLTETYHLRPWAGNLIVGFVILMLLEITFYLSLFTWRKRNLRLIMKRVSNHEKLRDTVSC